MKTATIITIEQSEKVGLELKVQLLSYETK